MKLKLIVRHMWIVAALCAMLAPSLPVVAATCYGGACTACRTCHYCRHCAVQGGTCSVCSRHAPTKHKRTKKSR